MTEKLVTLKHDEKGGQLTDADGNFCGNWIGPLKGFKGPNADLKKAIN